VPKSVNEEVGEKSGDESNTVARTHLGDRALGWESSAGGEEIIEIVPRGKNLRGLRKETIATASGRPKKKKEG